VSEQSIKGVVELSQESSGSFRVYQK
jgi:hypothetical protein